MTIESVPIDSIHPDPANVRRHPQRNLDVIAGSLMRFGQQKPIVVDGRNVVRAGNGTLAAAKVLGWTSVNVVRTTLAGAEAAAYAIADNRAAELAEWDPDALGDLLRAGDLGDVGFADDELAELLRAAAADAREQDAAVPDGAGDEDVPPDGFGVVVQCEDEAQQKDVFERLSREGFQCRLLTL